MVDRMDCAQGVSGPMCNSRLTGSGDLGFELGFGVVLILYIPLRYLERKWTRR